MTTETANLPAAGVADGKISSAAVAKQVTTLDQLAASLGKTTVDLSQFGDGLDIVENKDTLLGVPFVIFDSRFHPGDFGLFVTLSIATLNSSGDIVGRFILNDGSTGIKDQWNKMLDELPEGSLFLVKKGLRKSDYMWTDPSDGKEKPATTYYLDI